MKIGIVSGMGAVWGAYSPDVLDREDRGTVGGGEAAMLNTAFGLAAKGHDVSLYYPGLETSYRGVKFLRFGGEQLDIASGRYEAVVSWSDHRILMCAPKGVRRVYSQQLNDLPAWPQFWRNVDVILAASPNHAEFLRGAFMPSWATDVKWGALYFGLQPERYTAQKPLGERDPVVSYWSSPDRGLHHLLMAWPTILEAVPDAQLRIFYHLNRFRDSIRGIWRYGEITWRGGMLDELIARRMSGVQIMGPQPRLVLARHQMETKVWAMPFDPVAYTEGACSPPGTLITTRAGYKPIEQLTCTDEVLSHKGLWRRVTAVRSRQYTGTLLKVSPTCGESVEFTPEHPLMVVAPGDTVACWLPTGEVQPGMELLSVAPLETPLAPVVLPRRVIAPHRQAAGERLSLFATGHGSAEIPKEMVITTDLCRLLGYFAGNGTTFVRGGKGGLIKVTFRGAARAWADDCVALFATLFGLVAEVKDELPEKDMLTVSASSYALGYALRRWLYASDGHKALPPWMMALPRVMTEAVLLGLWRTDGSMLVVNRTGSRFAKYTSASPYLIDQTRLLLSALGYRTKISTRIHADSGRSFYLQLSAAGAFLDSPDVRRAGGGTTAFSRPLSDSASALKVRSISSRQYDGLVFNFDVERDNSYMVGNFVAHNCVSAGEALAAGCYAVARPDDALPSVYGDAIRWVEAPVCDARFRERFAEAVIEGLQATEVPNQPARAAVIAARTWAASTAALEEAILS